MEQRQDRQAGQGDASEARAGLAGGAPPEVDGRPVALVERPAAVDLIEAVNAIVLQ